MDARHKLGAPGRQQLKGVEETPGGGAASVSLFLRGREAFTPVQIAELERDGARIRTNAGSILTADVPVDAVDRVLSHDFVVAGDVSRPLYPEPDADPPIDIG